MHEESLEATHIYENDKKINSDKGDIYIQEIPDGNKAIIQLDDGVILEIWSNLIDVEIIKFIENINY